MEAQIGCDNWIATLWPLANHNLVTPDEMAEVLRSLHDTPAPEGLGDWLVLCQVTSARVSRAR